MKVNKRLKMSTSIVCRQQQWVVATICSQWQFVFTGNWSWDHVKPRPPRRFVTIERSRLDVSQFTDSLSIVWPDSFLPDNHPAVFSSLWNVKKQSVGAFLSAASEADWGQSVICCLGLGSRPEDINKRGLCFPVAPLVFPPRVFKRLVYSSCQDFESLARRARRLFMAHKSKNTCLSFFPVGLCKPLTASHPGARASSPGRLPSTWRLGCESDF